MDSPTNPRPFGAPLNVATTPSLLHLQFFPPDKFHRTDQTGRRKRICRLVMPPGNERLSLRFGPGFAFEEPRRDRFDAVGLEVARLRRIRLVADQAVDPEVRYADFEVVVAFLQGVRDIDAE